MNRLRIQQILVLSALLLGIGVVVLHGLFKRAPEMREVDGMASYMADATRWQGKYPPDFTLRLRNGESFHLAEHVGREIIILNFFTTWCGPCREEMPELQSYYMKHKGDHVVLVGINVDEKPELVEAYCRELKLEFAVGIDTNSVIATSYGVKRYPTTILVGTDGKVGLFQSGAIANADVVFESFVRVNLARLRGQKGISRADYEAGVKSQGVPPSGIRHHTVKAKEPDVKLEGSALAFAERMKCPSCGSRLSTCGCGVCESVKKKLAALTVAGKTDEQVLQELFMEGHRP